MNNLDGIIQSKWKFRQYDVGLKIIFIHDSSKSVLGTIQTLVLKVHSHLMSRMTLARALGINLDTTLKTRFSMLTSLLPPRANRPLNKLICVAVSNQCYQKCNKQTYSTRNVFKWKDDWMSRSAYLAWARRSLSSEERALVTLLQPGGDPKAWMTPISSTSATSTGADDGAGADGILLISVDFHRKSSNRGFRSTDFTSWMSS